MLLLAACAINQAMMSNRSSSSRVGGSDTLQQTKCSACNRDLAGSSKKCRKCKRYVFIKHNKQLWKHIKRFLRLCLEILFALLIGQVPKSVKILWEMKSAEIQ